MSEGQLSGYAGISRRILESAGAKIGDRIRVELKREGGQEVVEGLLMPRFKSQSDDYVVVKLKTGYNVGVGVDAETKVSILGKGEEPRFTRPPAPPRKTGLPKVSIISTGGTIASKVDYRTGAVKSALDAEDLYSVVPELAQVADIKAKILFSMFSENIGPQIWIRNEDFYIPTCLWTKEDKRPLAINLNTASEFDLATFPNISLKKAKEIIHERDKLGYFKSLEEAEQCGFEM